MATTISNFVLPYGRVAHTLPVDWKAKGEKMVLQCAFFCEKYGIPRELVAAFDHTSLQLLPLSNLTRARRGATEVRLQGTDDKRMVSTSL